MLIFSTFLSLDNIELFLANQKINFLFQVFVQYFVTNFAYSKFTKV